MKSFLTALVIALTGKSVVAQNVDLHELQGNIDIFTGVLKDALDLNQSSGLFGMSLGGVNATYLYRQGVLIEIRTPLANQRNRLNLASLNAAMQSMQAGINPFERMVNRFNSPAVFLEGSNYEEASEFYKDMMDRIAKVDYSLVISEAIQRASNAVRTLRALETIDEPAYEKMLVELDSMRGRLQEGVDQLNKIEEEMRTESREEGNRDADLAMGNRIDDLLAGLEPLKEEAIARAAEVMEQAELAEHRFIQNWNRDVREFENNLYAAMCDFGAVLGPLPDHESISFILNGLGQDSQNLSRRTDKVHVLRKSDVRLCQSGEIDTVELENRSAQYSY